jgi:glycosyltransferase involved in cell wall biosynthesis
MRDQITIALPVFKRTDFIRKALDSAVNQTKECSILLIDNNSPHDEFKTITDSYKNADIKYVKTDKTVPQDENFNNCFRYAETPWVTVLHDDDMLHCQYVENSLKILERYGETVGGIAYPSFVSEEEWVEVNNKRELTGDIRIMNPEFFYFNHLAFPGVLLKKDVALEIGGFNSDFHPIADFDFWYRYTTRMKMFYVNQVMSFYRISPSQSTNYLIDAMINNIYSYRLNLIETGRYNNFLSKLCLEHTRINNIKYFKDTYDSIEIPELLREKKFRRAKKIFKFRLSNKVVSLYKKRLSFSQAQK